MSKDICPICGAASRRQCDLPYVSGVGDIECQWELDPDILREDRDDRRGLDQEDKTDE